MSHVAKYISDEAKVLADGMQLEVVRIQRSRDCGYHARFAEDADWTQVNIGGKGRLFLDPSQDVTHPDFSNRPRPATTSCAL